MKMKFKYRLLIKAMIITNVIAYLLWSFIIGDLKEPILTTFLTVYGRGMYVMFLVVVFAAGAPAFLPFENEN